MKMNNDIDWLLAKAEAEDGFDVSVGAAMVGYPTAQEIAEKQAAADAQARYMAELASRGLYQTQDLLQGGLGAALSRAKVNCKDCLFWEATASVSEIQPAIVKSQFAEGPHRSAVSVPTVGLCRRRSASSGWPSTYPGDWCGEAERK